MWLLASYLALFLGGGGSRVTTSRDGTDLAPALELGAAYRVNPTLAVGTHTRVSRVTGQYREGDGRVSRAWDYTFWTADVGLAAQLTRGRMMLQPWVGAHVARGDALYEFRSDIPGGDRTSDEELRPAPLLTGGVLISGDLLIGEPHRLALFLDVQISSSDESQRVAHTYTGVTFGLAYRR